MKVKYPLRKGNMCAEVYRRAGGLGWRMGEGPLTRGCGRSDEMSDWENHGCSH